ncbi:Iron complex transport system substrate-binding protein OS=Streptomyces violarus OX=67380 GN=FHS41_003799 PE=3 SV=1 [Streptomyces violarus]
MSNARVAHLTRRGILAAGGALGLGAVLAACGDDDSSATGSDKGTAAAKSGAWSFKDDRGTTVKLDKVPTKIVAFTGVAAALYDYGIEVKGVFGPTKTKDGKADVQAGDMDVSKLTVFGNVWDRLNVEQYAAFAPEVLITTMFDSAGTLWYVPAASASKIAKLAPSVGVSVYDRQITAPLQKMWELAESPRRRHEGGQGHRREEAVRSGVGAAAGGRQGPPRHQGARRVRRAGRLLRLRLQPLHRPGVLQGAGRELRGAPASVLKESGGWYESLSWENVDKYKADIIMMDDRTATIQPADITEATWKKLPAVKAGQVISRSPEPILSYDKCVAMVENLAKAIETAKKVS